MLSTETPANTPQTTCEPSTAEQPKHVDDEVVPEKTVVKCKKATAQRATTMSAHIVSDYASHTQCAREEGLRSLLRTQSAQRTVDLRSKARCGTRQVPSSRRRVASDRYHGQNGRQRPQSTIQSATRLPRSYTATHVEHKGVEHEQDEVNEDLVGITFFPSRPKNHP